MHMCTLHAGTGALGETELKIDPYLLVRMLSVAHQHEHQH